MSSRHPVLVALLLSAVACAPETTTTPAPTSAPVAKPATAVSPAATVLEPYQCGAVQRIHTFGDIFLASQPTAADFEHAQKGGIRTVVNLRHRAEMKDFDEAAVVTALGLRYVNLPWNGAEELTDTVFDRARELLNGAERPLLVHCSSANRVGPLWIAWRMLDGGATWDQAHGEAVTIGMRTPAYAELARAYVENRQRER